MRPPPPLRTRNVTSSHTGRRPLWPTTVEHRLNSSHRSIPMPANIVIGRKRGRGTSLLLSARDTARCPNPERYSLEHFTQESKYPATQDKLSEYQCAHRTSSRPRRTHNQQRPQALHRVRAYPAHGSHRCIGHSTHHRSRTIGCVSSGRHPREGPCTERLFCWLHLECEVPARGA